MIQNYKIISKYLDLEDFFVTWFFGKRKKPIGLQGPIRGRKYRKPECSCVKVIFIIFKPEHIQTMEHKNNEKSTDPLSRAHPFGL